MSSPDNRSLGESIAAMESGVNAVAAQIDGMPAGDVVLLRILLMLAPELLANFEREVRKHGLGESEFRTLVMLFSHEDGCASPSELCGFDTQSRANMTRIGDVLVKRALVTRTAASSDRRRIELRITTRGRRLVHTLVPQLIPGLASAFHGIGPRQKQQLASMLKRIAANLDASRDDTAMTATSRARSR